MNRLLMATVTALGIVFDAESAEHTRTQVSTVSSSNPCNDEDPPWEQLSHHSGWCGPRVLYFLAQYLGVDPSLDDVVALCEADEYGRTTLARLETAARELDLDAEAVKCTFEDLGSIGGPAIIATPQSSWQSASIA